MTPSARVICIALAACATRTPSARDRALAQLPGDADLVAAADGNALADATFRKVIDGARTHAPAELGCVIDAMLASEATAVASSGRGATIVIVTRAVVSRCPALSQLEGDVFVATIGAGSLAKDRRESVLAAPRWRRLLRYLEREPVAIAIERDARRVLAVAQPAPLDAWIAIEGGAPRSIDDAEAYTATLTARWRTGATTLGSRVRTSRAKGQLLVRVDQLEPDDLVAITGDVLSALERPSPSIPPVFACPPPGSAGIVSCRLGTQLDVSSMWRALDAMTAGEAAPEISGGDVVGVRLLVDPVAVLRRGDIILGLDSARAASREQLQQLVRRAGKSAALAVRRDGFDVVLQLTQLE